MYHFARTRLDNRERVVQVDVIRQTIEYPGVWPVKVRTQIETWPTLAEAMARVRVLNEEDK
jgi:hypothetical protein